VTGRHIQGEEKNKIPGEARTFSLLPAPMLRGGGDREREQWYLWGVGKIY